MKYCTRCLYPANHPLNLTFDHEGVCSGCRVHEEKDRIDWSERRARLAQILEGYRNRSQSGYDCVIPVSGGRDSYFIVHTIKKEFGLNPLLVTYNRHYNTALGIENLSYLRTLFDCDIVTLTLDPRLVKRIMRATLAARGSMHWHAIAGQTVFPVRIAVNYKIPLVVWGAHQGLDQVGMYSHLDEVEMTRKYRAEHDLIGLEAEDLALDNSEALTPRELAPLVYPHDREIGTVGARGIYLGNYLRWDSKVQHEKMIELYSYRTARQQRTFDSYNDLDCAHYTGLHDYIKFLKFGYGKVSDHASREIRFGRLTREEGIDLVRRYADIVPNDSGYLANWLGISEAEILAQIDRFRDPRIWRRDAEKRWELADSILEHDQDRGVDAVRLAKQNNTEFISNAAAHIPSCGYQMLTTGLVEPKRRNLNELSRF